MADSASKKGFDGDGTRLASSGSAPEQAASGGEFGAGAVLRGKYRLEQLIGEGGMGSVWRAQHLQLELPVALKLLHGEHDKAVLTERMRLEAQAAARLVHPAIVRVFDIDASETGEPFIVMELLDGESLAALLERGRLSGVSAVQMLLPILEGLALAHAKGIVHRDLKPHNVFLAKDGEGLQPKLLDFGIAKLTSTPKASSLTDTGAAVGSPDYMSPEQARGQSDIDSRADIWQLCVVLYEAIAGRTPFDGDNYNALMRAIVEDDPAPLWLADDVDAQLTDLIFWGLAKDRAERPATAEELGRGLARWLIDRGVHEDVCNTPLASKWITRGALRSIPVFQRDSPDPPTRTFSMPAPATPNGTLVSARDASLGGKAAPVAPAPRALGGRRWWVAAGVFLLPALAWALWRVAASPAASSTPTTALSSAPGPSVDEPPARSAAVAPTPAAPSSINSTAAPEPLLSATAPPPSVSVARPRVPKTTAPPTSHSARPPVDHDDARELLQAY